MASTGDGTHKVTPDKAVKAMRDTGRDMKAKYMETETAHSDSRTDPTTAPVEHVLTLDCPEAPGIVHAVSRFLVEHGSDIIDNQQFGDRSDGHFFMRVRFATVGSENTPQTLRRDFAAVASSFTMRWHLEPVSTRRRVLIMVSRYRDSFAVHRASARW
ncbi:hypothetical protein [Streptomyces sp. NBC_00576]|uniref:hypothetical protein n=1 Tax=Streptomyces sp. NBC_00576 TaxID=2903665 RepID=UPI002E822BF2|nr:hypothetical protein [Streptomyces sp. NBC_00576]WUB70517.1 hypothetical protein OG734_10715 [Streptomyces sp. NBC_00576]